MPDAKEYALTRCALIGQEATLLVGVFRTRAAAANKDEKVRLAWELAAIELQHAVDEDERTAHIIVRRLAEACQRITG